MKKFILTLIMCMLSLVGYSQRHIVRHHNGAPAVIHHHHHHHQPAPRHPQPDMIHYHLPQPPIVVPPARCIYPSPVVCVKPIPVPPAPGPAILLPPTPVREEVVVIISTERR